MSVAEDREAEFSHLWGGGRRKEVQLPEYISRMCAIRRFEKLGNIVTA